MEFINRLTRALPTSIIAIVGSAGNALAAGGNSTFSGLNIRDGIGEFVSKLDPSFQPPVNWVIDHLFALAVIFTLLLLWYHSFCEKSAKRSGSISGQAQHESATENIMRNFGTSLVYSVLIIFFAAKCLI